MGLWRIVHEIFWGQRAEHGAARRERDKIRGDAIAKATDAKRQAIANRAARRIAIAEVQYNARLRGRA